MGWGCNSCNALPENSDRVTYSYLEVPGYNDHGKDKFPTYNDFKKDGLYLVRKCSTFGKEDDISQFPHPYSFVGLTKFGQFIHYPDNPELEIIPAGEWGANYRGK